MGEARVSRRARGRAAGQSRALYSTTQDYTQRLVELVFRYDKQFFRGSLGGLGFPASLGWRMARHADSRPRQTHSWQARRSLVVEDPERRDNGGIQEGRNGIMDDFPFWHCCSLSLCAPSLVRRRMDTFRPHGSYEAFRGQALSL